jgi:hypothetical protein
MNRFYITIFIKGQDDVNMCKLSKDKPTLEHYSNLIKTTPILMNVKHPTIGFSNIKTAYENGILTCYFRREKHVQSVPDWFNLSDEFHILTATGPIVAGTSFSFSLSHKSPKPICFYSSRKPFHSFDYEFKFR